MGVWQVEADLRPVAFVLHYAMDDTPITLLEYRTEDGHNPIREWLAGLRDREAAARVRVRLARIRLGNFGDCKPVGRGVSEIRVPYGPGYRVYFGRKGDTVVVLLCGGDKRTQEDDIELAQAYWAEYLRRAR